MSDRFIVSAVRALRYESLELLGVTATTQDVLTELDGTGEVFLAGLDEPLAYQFSPEDGGTYERQWLDHTEDGQPVLWVHAVVIRAHHEGERPFGGMAAFAVDLGYVVQRIGDDTALDPDKVDWVAVVEIDSLADEPSTPTEPEPDTMAVDPPVAVERAEPAPAAADDQPHVHDDEPADLPEMIGQPGPPPAAHQEPPTDPPPPPAPSEPPVPAPANWLVMPAHSDPPPVPTAGAAADEPAAPDEPPAPPPRRLPEPDYGTGPAAPAGPDIGAGRGISQTLPDFTSAGPRHRLGRSTLPSWALARPSREPARIALAIGAGALAVLAIIGLIVWLVSLIPDSQDQAAQTPSPTTTTQTVSSAARERLLGLLPAGYGPDACTVESATQVACGPNSEPGGPSSAQYFTAPNKAGLTAQFRSVVDSSSQVNCPGGYQSPGPWKRRAQPDKPMGDVFCGIRDGHPVVAWTNEPKSLLSVAQSGPGGPRMEELYQWWSANS